MVVAEETDNPARFHAGSRFFTDSGVELVVEKARRTAGGMLLKLVGFDDRTAVEGLRGATLSIPASERRSLGSDEFWIDELVGFSVRNPDGRRLGEVVDVTEGVGQDRLVVAAEGGRRVEIPFVAALVPEVNRDGRFVVVVVLGGMFDES